ncbi:MAG TPA: 2-phosphosulfolactate phosphatase [Thermomicrobiaceae bacterium]|nr:2-phosphosulfolactate phosphatase [Thermomicrobiaceae bacterium]
MSVVSPYYDQSAYRTRFEWGPEGVRALAPHSDVVVIVDVLTFSTAVDVAVGQGATVFPYRWRDASAERFAREHDAALAVSRGATSPAHPFSLSPASLQGLAPGARLVLPSPNGATLSLLAAEAGAAVLAGSLRNAAATARAAAALGRRVTVIAAGERWPVSDTLRPSIEDLIGAGAVLSALDAPEPTLSPEAAIALAAFAAAAPRLRQHLDACASGRELRELGFGQDVAVAAELNASGSVPILRDGAYVRWSRYTREPGA